MTMARRQLVDTAVTRHYHCISRCVRQASLCGRGFEHRKVWVEMRLEDLARSFAIAVSGFAILDNHLHILCRIDPEVAAGWTDEEVLRRWIAIYPPRGLDMQSPEEVKAWVDQQCRNPGRVGTIRERLCNLGWFMKAIKEPLSRLANKEDNCRGTFWEARYKSIAILDEAALLATCAYIDLNPLAAGIAKLPEDSLHTSIRQRIRHIRQMNALARLQAALRAGSSAAAQLEGDIEQLHWLCPLQDRRGQGSTREGLLVGFSLSGYLQLVDWTARLCRSGRARLSRKVAAVIERIGASAATWNNAMNHLLHKTRWLGNYCTTRPERLKAVALRLGRHRVENAFGCVQLQSAC